MSGTFSSSAYEIVPKPQPPSNEGQKGRKRSDQIREMQRLLKLKSIFRCWKMVKRNYLVESKMKPKVFCVKFSDFCKCNNCI